MMTATPDDLFRYLDSLGIEHSTIEHPPVFTVEDGREWHDRIPGLHCKNLFLKDRDGGFWLALMPGDKRAKLNLVEKRVGAARLSFGKPERLLEILGLTPGSVTPFGLMNDKARVLTVLVDEDLLNSERVNFHPLHNAASTSLRSSDLMKFIRSLGYEPIVVNCGEARN
jgi:Ala-tRNA(Pro) deacylase